MTCIEEFVPTEREAQALEHVVHVCNLDEKQRMVAAAFVRQGLDVAEVVQRLERLIQLTQRPVDKHRVLAHYGYRDGRTRECVVCLEDRRGGCAKDKRGRPIMVQFGNKLEGSSDDWIDQTLFAIQRCSLYHTTKQLPSVVFVFDMLAVGGYRFVLPDPAYFRFVFAFPSNMTVFVCGATPLFMHVWNLTKAVIPKELHDRYVLCRDYDELALHIDPTCMLPHWHPDASFEFNLDAYREWLEESETRAAASAAPPEPVPTGAPAPPEFVPTGAPAPEDYVFMTMSLVLATCFAARIWSWCMLAWIVVKMVRSFASSWTRAA